MRVYIEKDELREAVDYDGRVWVGDLKIDGAGLGSLTTKSRFQIQRLRKAGFFKNFVLFDDGRYLYDVGICVRMLRNLMEV